MMAKKDELVHYDFEDDECGVKMERTGELIAMSKETQEKTCSEKQFGSSDPNKVFVF